MYCAFSKKNLNKACLRRRGRNRRRRTRHSAADDHQIELASSLGLLLEPEQLSSPFGHRGVCIRSERIGIGREQDGIAAAFEAGQIVEGNRGLAADRDCPTGLPVPFGPLQGLVGR